MRHLAPATRETGVFQCPPGDWSSNWLRRRHPENHDCDAHEDANSRSNSETRQEDEHVFTRLPLIGERRDRLTDPAL